MLVIRLLRVGKKNQPAFKIVVTDKRNPARAGRFAEEVGFYNPLTKERILKKERVQYWLSQGAQPSPTIHNFLVKEGILEGRKITSHKKSKKSAEPNSSQEEGVSKTEEAPKESEEASAKESAK